MRTLLLAGVGAALLAGCGSPPAAPPPGIPGGGVATVRADLAGSGNPWLTLADREIDQRGRSVCNGLSQFGAKFYGDIAELNETTSPQPGDPTPDINRDQTLAMVKASVNGFCPERNGMITW